MNCRKAQRQAFLLESDELTGRRKREVERHLGTCPRCAAFHAEARRLLEAAGRAGGGVEGPSPWVMTRILARAREAVPVRRAFLPFRPAAPFAVAALLLILLAGWWGLTPPPERERVLAPGVADIQGILAMLSEEEYAASEQQATSHDDLLRQLARHLLRAEGIFDEDVNGGPFGAPQPTAPQSRSIPALPRRIRV